MSATGSATEPDVVTKASPRTVADTVSKLTGMIAAKGLTLFAVIDQREAAQKAGLDLRDTVLVVFGSPAAGTPVMAAVPLAALDLPLKALIWDDGGQTKVSYYDPAALAARHQVPADLAGNLAAINGLTDALVAPYGPSRRLTSGGPMTRFIKDDDFDDQFARTLSAAAAGCADLGEAFATADRIVPGDLDSWHREWARTAGQVRDDADDSVDAGHLASGSECYLRASEYYRQAFFYARDDLDSPVLLDSLRGSPGQLPGRAPGPALPGRGGRHPVPGHHAERVPLPA